MTAQSAPGRYEMGSIVLWVWEDPLFKEAAESLKPFTTFKGRSMHLYTNGMALNPDLYEDAKAIIFFAPSVKAFDVMVEFVRKNTKIKHMEGAIWARPPPVYKIQTMEAGLNGGRVKFYERSLSQSDSAYLYLKYIKRTVWWARRTPEWQAANPQRCQTKKRSALPREDEVVIEGSEPAPEGEESFPTPSSSKKEEASSPPPANTSLTGKEGGASKPPKGRRVRPSVVRG